jgi:hypothetical protein
MDPQMWTIADRDEAASEGWAFSIDIQDQQIVVKIAARLTSFGVKHEACQVFHNDDAALAYVAARAGEGSDMHARALLIHIANVPYEHYTLAVYGPNSELTYDLFA